MEFLAELKTTSQTKKVSLDNEYKIVFLTDNPMVMDLGKLSSDTRFKVTVEIDE